MYELKLSKLFRKQIKKIAVNSQPIFLDICESWDSVHRAVNTFGAKGNPFQSVRFAVKVKQRKLHIAYRLVENKNQLWIEAIVVKISKHQFDIYE